MNTNDDNNINHNNCDFICFPICFCQKRNTYIFIKPNAPWGHFAEVMVATLVAPPFSRSASSIVSMCSQPFLNAHQCADLTAQGGGEKTRVRTRAHEEHKAIHQVRSGNRSARQRHAAANGLTLHEKEEGVTGRGGRKRRLGTESNDMSGQN